jgi:anti-anti-sigma factor
MSARLKVIPVAQTGRHWSGTSSWRHEVARLAALMAGTNTRRPPRPLATRLRAGVFRASLSGEIDLVSSRKLTVIAQDFLLSDHASAQVDLRDVTFIDSTGLLLLVRLHRTASARGGTVTLLEPSEICLRALESVCFDKVFEIRRRGSTLTDLSGDPAARALAGRRHVM